MKQHNSPQWTRIADYYNEEGTYKDHFLYELSNNLGLLSGLRAQAKVPVQRLKQRGNASDLKEKAVRLNKQRMKQAAASPSPPAKNRR